MKAMAILAALALMLGCDDSAGSKGAVTGDTGGADMGLVDDAALPVDMARPRRDHAVPAADMGMGAATPAYVELTLAPRRPLYTRQEHPQVNATVFDRIGREIPDFPLRFDVQPGAAGTIDADGRLTFLAEGAGAVRGCVTSELCGRASFFVDDGPPPLVIETPARGAILSGDPQIEIRGHTEVAENTRVFINDRPVELDEQGGFTYTMRAELGLNRIDTIADDGVRRPPTRDTREVIWAPEVLVPGPDGVVIEDAVVIRLDQQLLDADEALPARDEMGAQRVGDLAGLVEVFLSRAEPLGLIGDPVISDDDTLRLVIDDIVTGTPDVSIQLVPDGMEVFLRLENLAIVTQGMVALEGEQFDLGGEVRVTAAAFAAVNIEPGPNGEPVLRVGEVGVAIEALGGVMNDSTAQALLDTLGSLVRTVLDRFAQDLVSQLVAEQVPEFIELGLGDALAPLANIPLDVELPPIALDLGFTLSDPRITARDALTLAMRGEIRQRGPVQAPHDSPGIPAVGLEADPIWPIDAGAAFAVRLLTVNALLDAVWRQGALQLDLTALLPESVSGVIRAGRIDARLPPLVVPGARGGPYAFEVQIGELDLYLQTLLSPAEDHYALSLRAGLILEVGDGGIRFAVADEPDLRVALIEAGGDEPGLPPDALARLLGPVVWGEVQNAVGEGLDLAIDPIVIGPDAFAELAPSIQGIDVGLTFPGQPTVRNGYFVFGAGLDLTVR